MCGAPLLTYPLPLFASPGEVGSSHIVTQGNFLPDLTVLSHSPRYDGPMIFNSVGCPVLRSSVVRNYFRLRTNRNLFLARQRRWGKGGDELQEPGRLVGNEGTDPSGRNPEGGKEGMPSECPPGKPSQETRKENL